MPKKIYFHPGYPHDNQTVYIVIRDQHPLKELTPERSQAVYNHSPDGFAYGYGGSGAAQLALAILLDALDDEALARANYQDFKWAFVAKWQPDQTWAIDEEEIRDWLADKNTAVGQLQGFSDRHLFQRTGDQGPIMP